MGDFNPFGGKLYDLRIWKDVRSQVEISTNMYSLSPDNTLNIVG